jgi:hypothetical protein
MSKETKQLRVIKNFAKEKTIPVIVGRPEKLNEQEYNKMLLEELGFEIKENSGGLFYCVFPKGWKKQWSSPLLEWVYLLDNLGRKRAAIFFKFMGYMYEGKRKAQIKYSTHINWMGRYRIVVDHVVPFKTKAKDNSEHYNSALCGVVVDDDKVIFSTTEYKLLTKQGEELYETEMRELRSKLYSECELWVREKYPQYDVITKYWDED